MGLHAYKSIWAPEKDEQLHAAMQPTNALNKYVVTVKKKEFETVTFRWKVGHIPLGKSGGFAKRVSYFLKANENSDCIAVVCGKPVNQSDGKGMKVLCTLQFTAEEKFIKMLKDQLETLL